MQKAGILHIQRGFTLVETMVTLAVLVILAAIAVPGLQAFTTRSGMNAIRDDFSIALQRARMDAISRNTCVSICQLAEGSTNSCVAAGRNRWEGGWIVFANPDCNGALPAAAIANENIVVVRQASDPRFQLVQKSSPGGIATFDPRGTLLGASFTVVTSDARYSGEEANPLARSIVVNRQGRVAIAIPDPETSSEVVQ